jgi:para-nitrobenzyl esterase
MRKTIVCLGLLVVAAGVERVWADRLAEPIKVDGGLVSGVPAWAFDVREFRGIPFAAPPVGNLRWRPPQPVVPWQGVKSAQYLPPPCMQQEQPLNGGSWNKHPVPFSEDCLYLNVWTPANTPTAKLPVVIFFYGGGGTLGYGGDWRYDGSTLAKKGVIVVTPNYRVNVFGWLAHPELTAESPNHASGNYGALDQIAAIKWVKQNIGGFGGDPDKITIWGQSGGARSVNWLVATPLAKGLFRGAIAQSHTVFGRMSTLRDAEQNGVEWAKGTGKTSLAELRALPADQVFAAFQKRGTGLNGAIVDGWVLPTDIYTIFKDGKQNDVALITGATNDEGGAIAAAGDDEGGGGRGGGRGAPESTEPAAPAGARGGGRGGGAPETLAAYTAWAQRTLGANAAALLKLYPAKTDAEAKRAYHDANRDGNFAGHRLWATLQAQTGRQPSYMYLFSRIPPYPVGNGNAPTPYRGAVHFADMVYAFNNLRNWDYPWTATDHKVADTMTSYWTNFVKTLDPNGAGLTRWPVYNPKDEVMLNIGDVNVVQRINTARMNFIVGLQEAGRTRR